MQLKMRENSLFAVLLRSPWWYSVLIAGFLVMIGQLFLSGKYLIYAIPIAFPFLVIAVIAGYRQATSPGSKKLEDTETWIRSARARDFTAALTRGYEKEGYAVTPFKGKAAELQIEKDERVRLVSCKRVKAASTGAEPFQALVTAGEHHEVAGLIYIGLGELSAEALDIVEEERIELVTLEELATLLHDAVREST